MKRSLIRRAPDGQRALKSAQDAGDADFRLLRPTVIGERDLTRYIDVLRRRWRTALVIFTVVAAGVSAGSLMRDPVYRATGLLEIRQGADAVPVETLFSTQRVAADDLETQFGILRSQALAERVVASLREPEVSDRGDAVAAWSAERFRKKLIVNPLRGSRLVEVSIDDSNPAVAARAVNSVFDNYLQLRMEEAQRSADWLESQLATTQKRLEDTESQLQAFVRRQGIEVLETGQGEMAREVNERIRFLSESLGQARAERFAKQSAFELTPRPTASRELSGAVAENLSLRLADLRRERAKLSSTFYDGYPAVKAIDSQIVALERALDDEAARAVARVRREYQAAVRHESLLRQALDSQSAAAQAMGQKAVGYQALKREVVTNQELFTLLSQKLKEVSISAALRASNVGVVDRPAPPRRPFSAPTSLHVGLAMIVGLLMAVGGVFLREHLDTSFRTAGDVDSYLGVPTLAAIPAVTVDPRHLPPGTVLGARGPWRRIDREGGSASPLAEAFATLRTAVLLNDEDKAPRSLLVTSARSMEGKTTVSVNLALSLARLKHRVLLVDANMRYPCVHEAFGLESGGGLVAYLTTDVYWRAFISDQVRPGLDVLTCGAPQTGAVGATPADLLSLPRMRDLVSMAERHYDFVVVDSPALLAHPADVRSLASLVDRVLLTVRQGATSREAVSIAVAQLDRVIGVVLNRSDERDIPTHHRDIPTPAREVPSSPLRERDV